MTRRIRIAVAALVRDGSVLLVHRHPARAILPDCWDLVGGHVEPGESYDSAVRRECFEELGIRVHDPAPFPMVVGKPGLDMRAFLVTRWDGEPLNAAPDEHDDLGWFRPEELRDLALANPAGVPDIVRAMRPSQNHASPRTKRA